VAASTSAGTQSGTTSQGAPSGTQAPPDSGSPQSAGSPGATETGQTDATVVAGSTVQDTFSDGSADSQVVDAAHGPLQDTAGAGDAEAAGDAGDFWDDGGWIVVAMTALAALCTGLAFLLRRQIRPARFNAERARQALQAEFAAAPASPPPPPRPPGPPGPGRP